MISATTGDGVADFKRALAARDARRPVAFPRGPGVRRHRPHGRRRADPRAALPPAPRRAALCERGRDREMGGPQGRLDRHPPADPGRARQPEGDRARQGRLAAQGDRPGRARGDRRASRPQGPFVPARQGQPAAGTRTAASTATSGWSGRTRPHLPSSISSTHAGTSSAAAPDPAFVEEEAALARLEVDLERRARRNSARSGRSPRRDRPRPRCRSRRTGRASRSAASIRSIS